MKEKSGYFHLFDFLLSSLYQLNVAAFLPWSDEETIQLKSFYYSTSWADIPLSLYFFVIDFFIASTGM